MPLDLSSRRHNDPASGPLEAYRTRIASGELRGDDAQDAVARALQSLFEALGGYRPRNGRNGRRPRKPPTMPRGIYLHGSVGRGKTMLMDLFFEALPVSGKRRVHFHAFMQHVHDTMHGWRLDGTATDDPIDRIAAETASESWILCFDEFHVDNIADAMILGRLFDALFARGVVVVATSNSAPEDLYRDGLQRDRFLPFIDLISERLSVMTLDGPLDYRRQRLRDMTLYHVPLGAESDRALEHAFDRLTDGATGAPAEIAVHGRRLAVARCARGVADMSFADLCEQPLGAADYLALAREFHTLLLRDVPLLTPDRRNEARRLVTLIDILYEHRINLVVSAAGPPDALYPEGDGVDVFQRAVSRLTEMQSADYLAGRDALS